MREIVKVREDFELEGLEKYGFEDILVWGDAGWVYDFTPYTKVKCSYLVIHSASREVIFDNIDFLSDAKDAFNVFFDLVKDGVVVKEVVE